MREILFRGKTIARDKWITGFLVSAKHIGDWIKAEPIQPETVGQFSGVTDKNGKKIFEGDIVHCISMTDMANMVVIFEDGEFRMVLCERYKEYIPGCGFYAIRCFDKEVIGNIHDNPELLEVE